MPQVPTYGAPKVARDPLSAGKLNPVQSDAGEVVGKAVQGLGDAIQSVGQTVFDIANKKIKQNKLQASLAAAGQGGGTAGGTAGGEDDTGGQPIPMVMASDESRADALEAQRQAEQDAAGISDAQLSFSSGAVQQLGPDGGLTGLQGRDALAAEPQVRQGIGDAFNDAVDSLPPGPARAQGVAALTAQRAGADRLVDGYMAGQPAVHYNEALAARVVGFQQQTAPLYLIDPALAEHNLGQMDLAQRELDQRTGVPLDRHVANQLQNRSTAWSSLVDNRIAAGDWHKAQQILTDRAGELTYADRARLQPQVTDGVNLADGKAWAEGSLTAGWAGRHGDHGFDRGAGPLVGIDPAAHLVRAAASAQGATLRERERLVAEAVTGDLVWRVPGADGKAGDREGDDGADAAVSAALERDRKAQQLAGQALGRAPDDWEVAYVARQPTPQAGAALLAAARDADAESALRGAGISPAGAQAVLASAGAQPGATVGEALDFAREGYSRALQDAARVASGRPQALFTPDHLPDRDAYLALADLAAGPDPARRQAFRAAAATHWQDLADAQQKARTDALDAVAPELSQVLPYSKWTPAKQAALHQDDRTALIAFEGQGSQAQPDQRLFAAARAAYADNPEALLAANPTAMIGRLSPAQFRQVIAWRADLKGRTADEATDGQLMAARLNSKVLQGLRSRGVDLPPPPPAALAGPAGGSGPATPPHVGYPDGLPVLDPHRAGEQTMQINGVTGLRVRIMQPDQTGAADVGEYREVAKSLMLLPPSILRVLAKKVHWVVTPDSVDQAFPDDGKMLTNSPRGWNDEHTPPDARRDWGDASSVFWKDNETVVVGTPDDPHLGDGSFDVTLHETGHAWDKYNHNESKSDAFRDAYNADVPLMTPKEEATPVNPSDAYFLQPGGAGQQEAYAEAFARYFANDPDLEKDWPHMYKYFQKAYPKSGPAVTAVH